MPADSLREKAAGRRGDGRRQARARRRAKRRSRCAAFDDLLVVPRALLQSDSRREDRRLHHARQGVSVHSATCPNVVNLLYDPERRIDVEWDKGDAVARYTVKLTMEVEDRKGLLAAVSAKIADINTNIKNMEAHTDGRPARAHRHDRRDQRPQAPREGDEVAAQRRRCARRREGGRAGGQDEPEADSDVAIPSLQPLSTSRSRRSRCARRAAAVATCTVARAGYGSVKYVPYTSFMAAKSFMSARKTVVRTTSLEKSRPPAVSSAPMFSSTRRVCAAMSPVTSAPVAGSMGTCPETNSNWPARRADE